MRWMKLEPIIQSEVSQKEKHQHSILTHIYMELRKMGMMTVYVRQQKRHRCIEQSFFNFFFIFKLYNIVLVLPNIKMNLPQVYPCSPS